MSTDVRLMSTHHSRTSDSVQRAEIVRVTCYGIDLPR